MPSVPHRVAVIGAGAIGGTVAALLHRAGHDVEVAARDAGLDAIRGHGIRLSGAWGEHTATVRAAETLTVGAELTVIATKAMDSLPAALANREAIGDGPVVVFQNGFGGLEQVAAELRPVPVLGALSLIAASLTAPGAVTVTTPAETWLGVADSAAEAPADALRFARALLADAIPCRVEQNFDGARWSKLIVNQVNALPAITGLSVQETIQHDGLRRILTRSMREAVRVGLVRGVRFADLGGITHEGLRVLAHAPLRVAEYLPWQLLDYLGQVPNPGSTLQSIRRGQRTEIDYLNGAVVAFGEGTGVTTAVNARLTALVHEVEETGTFWAVERLVAEFARRQ